MVRYNLSMIDAENTTSGMVSEIVKTFNGYPWYFVMLILWIAAFVFATNRNSSPDEAMLISSFFMSIVAGLSYLAELISIEIAIIPLVVMFGSYIYLRSK